ncbi:MAG: hypothetical protein GY714_09140 [Desulfobacterales bacterium]|nr:hypothetical protein [Desulfobacterales bacterium]
MKIKINIIMIIVFSVNIAFSEDPMKSNYQKGVSSGNEISNQFSSPDKINEKIFNPLSGSGELKTVDGSKKGAVKIQAPSSKSFLKVSAFNTATGDISIIVNQDIDLDGKFDFEYHVPSLVSGVCANGFVSCTPGTFTNEKFYKWKIVDKKTSTEQVTELKEMSGCYCVNNSCNSKLFTNNIQRILRDVAGGLVSVIQKDNPQLAISSTENDSVSITFFGQEVDGVGKNIVQSNPNMYQSGTSDPQKYYELGSLPGDEEKDKQKGNDNSSYNVLMSSHQAKNPKELKSCRVDITPYIDIVDEVKTPKVDIKNTCSEILNDSDCNIYNKNACGQNGLSCVSIIKKKQDTGLTLIPQQINLDDFTFTANSNQIIYTQGSNTGVVIAGENSNFTTKYEFLCTDSDKEFNYDDSLNSTHNINESVEVNGSNVAYEAFGRSNSISMPYTENPETCEKVCKVELVVEDNEVGNNSGELVKTWDKNKTDNNNKKEYLYLACKDNICPNSEDQNVVDQCKCINKFPEAIGKLQSIKNASKDMICTQ